MRKKILKIVPILIILILGILTIKVNASYRSNDPTVESGGTFSITISSTEKIENFDANLTGYSGLTFVSCSGVDNTVIVNNGKLSGATIGGYTTLGTYTFKAPEVTEKKTFKVSFNINGTTIQKQLHHHQLLHSHLQLQKSLQRNLLLQKLHQYKGNIQM